jgi:hypothetical protein
MAPYENADGKAESKFVDYDSPHHSEKFDGENDTPTLHSENIKQEKYVRKQKTFKIEKTFKVICKKNKSLLSFLHVK